jgi:ER membrane protein complex subunit 1
MDIRPVRVHNLLVLYVAPFFFCEPPLTMCVCLLVASMDGQLLTISKDSIDTTHPRSSFYNTVIPTATNDHDPLLPTLIDPSRDISVSHQKILSYWRHLHRIRHIIAIPTRLESTSIVFAYGHDMYMTWIAPVDTFDCLKPNFNKPLLLITLISLAVIVCIASRLAHQKHLNTYWQQ